MYRIDRYLAVRYKLGGREYPLLDCWGLVLAFYRDELGIILPLEEAICDSASAYIGETDVKSKIAYIEKEECLLDNNPYIVCFYNQKRLFHCGILLNNHVLHTRRNGTVFQKISSVKKQYRLWELRYYEVTGKSSPSP